jgi:hypothetical protein
MNNMIGEGFCQICGRRLDADPDRPNDGKQHLDCKRQNVPKILKNLGVSKEERMKRLHDQEILTTDKYWDCECLANFIHPKSQKKCDKCGAVEEEQPDSRVNEVLAEGFLV